MKYILNVLRGFIIGVGNVIPGLSGGSMAFILGIYEKLISSPVKFLKQKQSRLKILFFWISLGVGLIVGILFFSHLMNTYLQAYGLEIRLFFVGLVLGSLPAIYLSIDNIQLNKKTLLAFFLGALVMVPFLIISIEEGMANEIQEYSQIFGFIKIHSIDWIYALKLFIAGFIAVVSMIIPGISGSFLLLLMGEYQNIVYFVDERFIVPIIFIGLGAVLGGGFFVYFLADLIKKYKTIITYFILGLMLMSVGVILKGYGRFDIVGLFNFMILLFGVGSSFLVGMLADR